MLMKVSIQYLGVLFDPKLRWTAHHEKVTASATWWSLQVSRLSRVSGGMPPSRVRLRGSCPSLRLRC